MPDSSVLLSSSPAFLNVECSAMGRRWQRRPVDDRAVMAITQAKELPEVVARVLVQRGVTLDGVDGFLSPTLRSMLPDPSHLKDMDAAADRIARAIVQGEKIAVFGDYDVDGATSSALLRRYLRSLGSEARIYIPDRIREGYGPNAAAMQTLRAEGASLCITVDCGVTAFGPLDAAAEAGLDVVIIDHHAAEPRLPRAVAVVNPNRVDDTSPHRNLAAVGVTFLTLVAINRRLRQMGFFAERKEPDLLRWLDLVAVGTVCDVVPLTGLNRPLVAQGLKILAKRGNIGLAALGDVARLDETPDTYHAGYIIGPRINAGGRVGECDLGARLLSTDDPVEARALALELDASNTHRKVVEAGVLEQAIALADSHIGEAASIVYAVGQGWHPGVIGIVASRLKERFNRPAFVVGVDDTGMGKASGRSVRGVDMGAAVIAARHAGLLLAGGGHAMAAGFSVAADRIEELGRFLAEHIARQQSAGPLAPTMDLDGMITVGGATLGLVQTLATLAPFGTGNPEPRFVVADARIVRADVVGANHVRCILSGVDGSRLKAIAFRALETPLGDLLMKSAGAPVHLAGQLRIDRYQGQTAIQLLIDDAARPVG